MTGAATAHAATWLALTASMPWLCTLPTGLVAQLDLDEFVVPGGWIGRIRGQVEERTGTHIMTYRRLPSACPPDRIQLCQIVAPAALDSSSIDAILQAERRLDRAGVILCAYLRPLRLLHE